MIFKFKIYRYVDPLKNGEYTHDIIELREFDLEEIALQKWEEIGGEIHKLKSISLDSIDLER